MYIKNLISKVENLNKAIQQYLPVHLKLLKNFINIYFSELEINVLTTCVIVETYFK